MNKAISTLTLATFAIGMVGCQASVKNENGATSINQNQNNASVQSGTVLKSTPQKSGVKRDAVRNGNANNGTVQDIDLVDSDLVESTATLKNQPIEYKRKSTIQPSNVKKDVEYKSNQQASRVISSDNKVYNSNYTKYEFTPNQTSKSTSQNSVNKSSELPDYLKQNNKPKSPVAVDNNIPQVNQSRAAFNAPYIRQYETMNAFSMAKKNPELSILVEMIEAAGISNLIRFAGSKYTILAPNNVAFEKLFQETTLTKQSLLQNKSLLRLLLSYHVVKSKAPMSLAQLPPRNITTLSKRQITVNEHKNIIDARGRAAKIVKPNIATKNGTVHIIDTVLFPKS